MLRDLPRFDAEDQMQLITAITFPHWGGDSKNPKESARQGNRKRTKYLDALGKAAGGEGASELLTTGEQLERWFHAHGLSTA